MKPNAPTYACVLGLVVPIVSACTGPPSQAAAWSVRDSAGIRIVESTRASWSEVEAWQVEVAPTVRIAHGPEQPLHNLVDVARLPDGRIVVANQSSSQVLFYDSEGRLTEAVGGEGDGPGEFRDIAHLAYCWGDSMTIFDRVTLRASVMDLEGAFGRSFTPRFVTERSIWPRSVECRGDGTSLIVGWGRDPERSSDAGRRRSVVPVFVVDSTGATLADLGEFEGNETQHWVDADGSGWWGPAPFGRRVSILLVGDGLYVAPGDDFEIAVYGLDRALTQLIRWRGTPVSVTSGDMRRFEQALLDSLNARRRDLTEPLLGRVEYPEVMPPYGIVLRDASGHLWVEEFRNGDESPPGWTIFSPEGRMLGKVVTPAGLEIHQIDADLILGVERDDFGVESVAAYRLNRRGDRP